VKFLRFITAYTFWLVLIALASLIFIWARSVFQAYLGANFIGGSYVLRTQARLYDQIVTILLGLSWFIFVIVSEEYLRRTINRGGMVKQFIRYLGVELLILFILDGLQLYFQGIAGIDWIRVLVLTLELGGGAVCIYFGWSDRSPLSGKAKNQV
jgi:hypothetical protein